MDDLQLLIDLHMGAERQGPGDIAETLRAIDLSGLRGRKELKVADIGCGTGASTFILAAELDADIVAVDFLPEFIDALTQRATQSGLNERISVLTASMDALPFQTASLDAIWSEGAIYNIGFEKGVQYWRQFLKPGGILAVSELTWLTADRPAELQAHWHAHYPEVGTASSKLAVLERHGLVPIGYFVLPEHCWLDNYYGPLKQRFPEFLARHGLSDAAVALVAAEQQEIELYERFKEFFSYGFYIARATGARLSPHR